MKILKKILYKYYFAFMSFMIRNHLIGKESIIYLSNMIPNRKKNFKIELYKKISILLKKTEVKNNYYSIITGHNLDFSDLEVVLLAHYDKNKIISDYVIYTAEQFKAIGKKVILCSGHAIEYNKKYAVFDAIICRLYDGYDFTSWKCAFYAFPSLYNTKEITFTNDSIFAPIGSYSNVYKTMKKIRCDFWGISLARGGKFPHLQSFFIVFYKSSLKSFAFHKFIDSIRFNNSKKLAVYYEFTLSIWLELNGLQAACYRPYFKYFNVKTNPMSFWYDVVKDGIPLIKRSRIMTIIDEKKLIDLIELYGYPVQLVTNLKLRQTSNTETRISVQGVD